MGEYALGLVRRGVVTGLTVCDTEFTEGQDIVLREEAGEDPAEGRTRIEIVVVAKRQGRRPVVTGGQVEEEHVLEAEGDVAEQADQAALALTFRDRGLGRTVGQIPETGVERQHVSLAVSIGIVALVDVETGGDVHVEGTVEETVRIVGEDILVGLISAAVMGVDITVLIHVRRGITVVIGHEGSVHGNLRGTELAVEVRIVETVAIGQREVLERLQVGLDLTVDLLAVEVVVVVGDSPVRVGDAVRGEVSRRVVERIGDILVVHDGDVTGHLIDTVDHGSALELADHIGLAGREVDRRGNPEPLGRIVGSTGGDSVTGIGVSLGRDDTVIRSVGVGQVVGQLAVVRLSAHGDAVVVGNAQVEEILDVGRHGRILMDELGVVPDRAIHLDGAVKLRTPGTILDIGLGTVPALSIDILELGQDGDLTELETTVVLEGEVAVETLLTTLGRDDDDTVRSAASVQGRSGGALQDGHALDIIRRHVGKTGGHRRLAQGSVLIVLERNAIHDVEGLVGSVDGAVTTDDDRIGRSRVSGSRADGHTGHLTLEGVGDAGVAAGRQFITLDGGGGIAESLLRTGDAHRRDDNLIEEFIVDVEDGIDDRCDCHHFVGITDAGKYQVFGSCRYRSDNIGAVCVSDGA